MKDNFTCTIAIECRATQYVSAKQVIHKKNRLNVINKTMGT